MDAEDTQKQQKEVLVRLDEMIKEMENKAKNPPPPPGGGDGGGNGGNCPEGGSPGQREWCRRGCWRRPGGTRSRKC